MWNICEDCNKIVAGWNYIDVSTRNIELSTNHNKKEDAQNEHPLSIY
ncbi:MULTISPECIES: hypothetical protein [Bacillus]|nr:MULTISPECIES: hypothetical protein [Bacillus]MED1409436.1 hypothetical protein [Bacillus paramycoides]MED1463029.1 hypothetical protein [Bacillus paramycoides]MED1492647.1 hypothetical protein [Bacillus paramycoides]